MSEHDNCHVDPVVKPVDHAALSTSMVAYLAVQGMGCPNCAARVRNGLLGLTGVFLVDVLFAQGIAGIAYDPTQVTPDDLVLAVASADSRNRHHYQAEVLTISPASETLIM